ncbi:testis-specific serine/threonine-protein kinase 4-like [Oppia nitens]|uniref:testis-specific serine/threonine-protein kinase 4-like n=1 Tax=Oppia nitens TaxID=1686743 RepID=UPI0023DAABFB|nr:testis-specific serine/threonine-protein kinase 4-like [Oppia nitens]
MGGEDKKDETINLDPKTEAVFKKKGYELQKKLAEGAFGQVYKAKNTKTGDKVAVKVMNLDKVGEKFKEKFLPREMAALIGVKHENTCELYDIIKANHRLYIFMEFCGGGDISGYVQKNGALSEEKTCFWFTQTAQALSFMHQNLHMAHRDIKIDNILLTENQMAKLTDFGFAKICWDEKKDKMELSKTYCGTEPYECPQIVARVPYNAFAADVWAMGVVLFCMLQNKFPFHWNDKKKFIKEQKDKKYIEERLGTKLSQDCRDLHIQCWTEDEGKRITSQDLLNHPWITRKGK